MERSLSLDIARVELPAVPKDSVLTHELPASWMDRPVMESTGLSHCADSSRRGTFTE
jgi:hypothetical protein